jgi:hypothetical protein
MPWGFVVPQIQFIFQHLSNLIFKALAINVLETGGDSLPGYHEKAPMTYWSSGPLKLKALTQKQLIPQRRRRNVLFGAIFCSLVGSSGFPKKDTLLTGLLPEICSGAPGSYPSSFRRSSGPGDL